jgi:hypothetical protein
MKKGLAACITAARPFASLATGSWIASAAQVQLSSDWPMYLSDMGHRGDAKGDDEISRCTELDPAGAAEL